MESTVLGLLEYNVQTQCINLIEEPLMHENHERYDPNVYWEIEKMINVCDKKNVIVGWAAWIKILMLSKKEIVLNINNWSRAKRSDAV